MVDKVDEKGNSAKINRYTYSFIFRLPTVWRNIRLIQLPVSTKHHLKDTILSLQNILTITSGK